MKPESNTFREQHTPLLCGGDVDTKVSCTRNIRLLISYDGTDFSGWQKQAQGARTVQGVIEEALEKINKEKITLTGSGRTDAGVHAAGQVANFFTSIKNMDAGRFVPALNSLLPQDVRILEANEANIDFHSRFEAKYRTYRYYIIPGATALSWELRYAWRIWRRPRISVLNEYASLLHGETDCTVFAVPGDKSHSRKRYIYNTVFWAEGKHIIFEITANAFLWKMVRSVVGTLLFYEEKNISRDKFREIITSKDRSLAGPTAPANGLFLWNIGY
ncbi:MAG: tRNA pseudouridine(38-40) synthase TruA [Treponema sp.]|jgi:tRNA pseudouridine38-40 synthase|nr:tRNA pseudouridine(38-40) synthase TruA [Treponema sp.]